MEMPSKQQPRIAPSPFTSASVEREELTSALLSSSVALPAESSTADADTTTSTTRSLQNYFVPTAVPITSGNGDAFDDNDSGGVLPLMATVTASTIVDLPPPPPVAASAATAASSSRRTQTKNNTEATSKKESAFEGDEVLVRPEPPSTYYGNNINNNYPFPSAPTVPTHTTHLATTQQVTTSAQLRAANVQGNISSELETADVARAQRDRHAIQHGAKTGVRAANERAARKVWREDEGLTVDEGIHNLTLNSTNDNGLVDREQDDDDDDVRRHGNKRQGKKGGGYDVQEYDVKGYETNEYDVSEYKSVYD